jgi:predicted molibdopterin-dependent oxidoreductase YjgC
MTAFSLHRSGPLVEVLVDGQLVRLPQGMVLATALATAGYRELRRSPRVGSPRGAFCLMGACQECAIFVDGALRQACMSTVQQGMQIELRGAP